MNLKLRQENHSDYHEVESVVEKAFQGLDFSDQTEHLLVKRLRKSDSFVPELSIIAELDGKIVGHILLTKIQIIDQQNSYESLSMAPVSVLPEYQKMGIGSKLILEAHQRAKQLGFESIIVLGHSDYYPKFGYQLTRDFGIDLPFDAPEESCMILELKENSLHGIKGKAVFPKAFYE